VFENFTKLAPGPYQFGPLETPPSQVIAWSEAPAPLRTLSRTA
jgi:hypothetical protein